MTLQIASLGGLLPDPMYIPLPHVCPCVASYVRLVHMHMWAYINVYIQHVYVYVA